MNYDLQGHQTHGMHGQPGGLLPGGRLTGGLGVADENKKQLSELFNLEMFIYLPGGFGT